MTSIPKGTWTCAFACTLSSMELHFLLDQGDKLLIILHYPPLTASPKLPCTPLSWVAIFHFSASLGFILTTINTSFLSHNIYLLSSHSDFFLFWREIPSAILSPLLDTDKFFNKYLLDKSICACLTHVHIITYTNLHIFTLVYLNMNTHKTRNNKMN